MLGIWLRLNQIEIDLPADMGHLRAGAIEAPARSKGLL